MELKEKIALCNRIINTWNETKSMNKIFELMPEQLKKQIIGDDKPCVHEPKYDKGLCKTCYRYDGQQKFAVIMFLPQILTEWANENNNTDFVAVCK